MPTVYIPNDNGQDFSPAHRFGNLVVLSQGDVRNKSITAHFDDMCFALKDANQDDKLILVGPGTIIAMCSSILYHRFGVVHYLLYQRGQYHEYTLRVSRMERVMKGETPDK